MSLAIDSAVVDVLSSQLTKEKHGICLHWLVYGSHTECHSAGIGNIRGQGYSAYLFLKIK